MATETSILLYVQSFLSYANIRQLWDNFLAFSRTIDTNVIKTFVTLKSAKDRLDQTDLMATQVSWFKFLNLASQPPSIVCVPSLNKKLYLKGQFTHFDERNSNI